MPDPETPAALLAEDEESRRRALELASFIVDAPAGAGKTELLTQRYLRLLAVVGEPEEIVALTFTNKAAAEMKNRILDALSLAAAGAPARPEAEHKRITFDLALAALAAGAQRGWRLLEQPSRLRILTMDALNASLARQMPLLSRFGAPPGVAEQAATHYRQAAQRLLLRLEAPGEGEEGALAELVAAALAYLDNDSERFLRLFAAMLARRDQWLRAGLDAAARAQAEAGIAGLLRRDLAQAAQRLDATLQQGIMAAARYAAANVDAGSALSPLAAWQTPLGAEMAALPSWRALAELLLTRDGKLRQRFDKNLGLSPGKQSEPHKRSLAACIAALAGDGGAAAALARLRALPEPRYDDSEWALVEVLRRLLELAAAELWEVFRAAGEVDFVEVAQRALAALGEEDRPSDLALQLDYRIAHLLVDEFQDTSPTQVQLLARLAAGWMPGDGRTLFLVGDPMQSIYRFRKAEVGLFINAGEAGLGGLRLERLRLLRNNRSAAAIVAWVNENFTAALAAADDVARGAIAYRHFVASRAPDPAAGVRIHPILLTGARGPGSAAAERSEAALVLELIDAERRLDPARRIAVLVRSRRHLAALVEEIRRHRPDLRYAAVDIEPLAQRQVVQDLLALTRALCHRADRVHALAVLRAPWCGLTLADLHALAADDQETTIHALLHDEQGLALLSADGRARALRLRDVLDAAYREQGRLSLRRWVEGVWLQLGGPACLGGAAEAADARAYLDLLEALDALGRFSLETLEQELARLYAAPDALADGTLQFMTIHKAKGLEFDCVILPGLHKRGRSDEPDLMLWEEVLLDGVKPHLVVAPLLPGRAAAGEPSLYDYLRRLEQERAANEEGRVLYVAATRAQTRLHLVAVLAQDEAGAPVRPAGTFADLLWPAFSAACAGAGPLAAALLPAASSKEQGFVPKLQRLAASSLAPLPVAAPQPASAAAPARAGAESALPSLDASVGILVHLYLDLIARSGPGQWTPARLASLAVAMQRWLAARGHAPAEALVGARRVAAALAATLASEAGRWVLALRPDADSEAALSARVAGGVARMVVDRSFVEAGCRWIIDYKTAPLGEDASAAAMACHAERYRAQLERYAALYAGEGLPQRLALLYCASGSLVELERSLR